jgi:hypothetical protein
VSDSEAEGVIIVQGGDFGGWVLSAHEDRIERTTRSSSR